MSTQLKILVGLIFTLLTCIPLAAVAINDLGMPNAPAGSTRMEERAASLAGRDIQTGAEAFGNYCASCHGKQGEGIPSVAPALNRKDLFDGRRQKDVGWSGSAAGFLKNTIAAGRPVRSRPDLYSVTMPTWSPPGTPRHSPTPGPSPTPAPTRQGVNASCQNVPAQFVGKKSPFAATNAAALAEGKKTYDEKCAACHGTGGQGNGPAAGSLNPKPATFTDKAYMQGLPVDCHFFRISEGVQGTGMPPWRSLGENAIWQVLIYERQFAGVGLGPQ
ncbi:MAG: c-type cytochrome [Chloroflexi bacterium]|nr:c-type cytochrome [Chloroflexota bacterium]